MMAPLQNHCHQPVNNNEKSTCNLQCVPAWRPPTQPNLREYRRPSYEPTPLCTDLRNNGWNMLVLKFWSAMRMREISGLDSQLVRWPLDDKYGQALTDLVTRKHYYYYYFFFYFFYFFKYVTVITQACLLNYHLFTLTTKWIIHVCCVHNSVIYTVLYYRFGSFFGNIRTNIRPKTNGGTVYRQILINAKLQIGKRGKKTEIIRRNTWRKWRSAMDYSAI
jgi:hypothetical protein